MWNMTLRYIACISGFNLFIQFEKIKKTAEFNDTSNNTHVKIETPGYYRVRFIEPDLSSVLGCSIKIVFISHLGI